MTQKQKYYVVGAAALGLIAFLSYKAFAKKKLITSLNPVKPKPKPTIIVGPPTGGFELPADITTRSGTRLRSESNTNSAILKTYNAGVKLLVIDNTTKSDGQWFKVKDSSGNTGWMRSDVVDYKITTSSGEYGSEYFDYYSYLDQILGV
jgi:uncharacterized protein YgiM (DUF1202 family)